MLVSIVLMNSEVRYCLTVWVSHFYLLVCEFHRRLRIQISIACFFFFAFLCTRSYASWKQELFVPNPNTFQRPDIHVLLNEYIFVWLRLMFLSITTQLLTTFPLSNKKLNSTPSSLLQFPLYLPSSILPFPYQNKARCRGMAAC